MDKDSLALLYSAIAAWGTWATVLCALVVVWSQNRSSKRIACLQLFVQLSAQYDSSDMRGIRRRLADKLLSDLKSVEVEDSLPLYFENLAILSRRRLLDRDLMWNTFVFDVPRYWHVLKHYVEFCRKKFANPAIYEEFQLLATQLSSQTRSPLGTELPPLDLSEDDIREFLRYESRIGGQRSDDP